MLEILGWRVSLAGKETEVLQGLRAPMEAVAHLEVPGSQDFLETQAAMERKVPLVPVDLTDGQETWESPVFEVRKVRWDLVGNVDQMGSQDLQDPKVRKVNRVRLDQVPKGLVEKRGIQDFLDFRVQRGYQERLETLVLQEAVAPLAPKVTMALKDAEVRLGLLVRRVVMVLQVKLAPLDLLV